MSLPSRLAFIDVESTGAHPVRDRITEIAILRVEDGEVVARWESLVAPGQPIPPLIEEVTGISDAMVAEAPAFEVLADTVAALLEGCVFVAHSARFDYGFIRNAFTRIGREFEAPVLCTVKLSRALFPEHRRHNLDSLIERHGLQAEARHRALADAQLIFQFWQKIRVDRSDAEIKAALKAQNANPSLPPQLDPGLVDDLPDGPGVYLFYGENALPLYIGKAKDIRQRVLSHFAGDHASANEMALALQVRRIDWIETAGEIGALLKESALVKALQPVHNRQLRRNDELCTWTLVDEGEGWLRPQLVLASEVDFGLRTSCYGLFKHAREANEVLRALAQSYHLCDILTGLEKASPGKPCFGYQVKRCKGACIGRETLARHTTRLMTAFAAQKLVAWPFAGPALIRERDEAHLIDAWRYLGTARSDEELQALREAARPPFDRDAYRLLAKHVGRMVPLG